METIYSPSDRKQYSKIYTAEEPLPDSTGHCAKRGGGGGWSIKTRMKCAFLDQFCTYDIISYHFGATENCGEMPRLCNAYNMEIYTTRCISTHALALYLVSMHDCVMWELESKEGIYKKK